MNSKFTGIPSGFYISHFTTLESLVYILKIGSLLPLSEQRKIYGEKFREPHYYNTVKGIGDVDVYDKSTFCSIIFPEDLRIFNPNPNKIYLMFSPNILLGRKSVFCKGWSYGKIKKDSICSYSSDLTIEENLNIWKNISKESFDKTIHPDSGTFKNELLIEGRLNFKYSYDSLRFIYVPKNDYIDKKLLETLIFKNPNLAWIFETLVFEKESKIF